MIAVLSEGSTDVSDIGDILTGYFDCDTHLQSADDFYMLVVSVVEWLRDFELSDTQPEDLVKTLLNLSKAVNTMVNGLGTSGFQDMMYPPLPPRKLLYHKDIYPRDIRHPFYGYGDNIWRILLPQEASLFEQGANHLLTFGPLLHVIAEGFIKQVFFVAEEWPGYLHSALREVHARDGCSDESCRWASHDYGDHDVTECPLLVKTSLEVEASSSTNHNELPPPIDQSHTPPRFSTSISRPGSVSKVVEGTNPVSHSNPVTIQGEWR